MYSDNMKIRQLVDKCDEANAKILAYSIKRLHEDWNDLTHVAIVEYGNNGRVHTMIYDKDLKEWN